MLRQPLYFARRDLDLGVAAAIRRALRTRITAHRDGESLAVPVHAETLRERRELYHLNPFPWRIRFIAWDQRMKRDEMKTLRTVVAVMTIFAGAEALGHGRLADVSVYDRSEARWLQVYRHDGRMYVEGKPGHEYQIRLANRLREDLLAVISVDGVNVITGQTDRKSGV